MKKYGLLLVLLALLLVMMLACGSEPPVPTVPPVNTPYIPDSDLAPGYQTTFNETEKGLLYEPAPFVS